MNDKDVEEFRKWKSKVEKIKAKAEQAKGVRSQTLKVLKEEFGCTEVEATEKRLKKLKQDREKAREKYESLLSEFKEKWEDTPSVKTISEDD